MQIYSLKVVDPASANQNIGDLIGISLLNQELVQKVKVVTHRARSANDELGFP